MHMRDSILVGAKLQDGVTGDLCAVNREDDNGGEDAIKPIDPLLQLITLFSQSALMERRCVFADKGLNRHNAHVFTSKPHHQESRLIWQLYSYLVTAKSFISVFQYLQMHYIVLLRNICWCSSEPLKYIFDTHCHCKSRTVNTLCSSLLSSSDITVVTRCLGA